MSGTDFESRYLGSNPSAPTSFAKRTSREAAAHERALHTINDRVDSAAALRAAVADAGRGLVERETLVELVALVGEHLLVIGPPGTAKSEAVRRVAKNLDARYFEYLLGLLNERPRVGKRSPRHLAKVGAMAGGSSSRARCARSTRPLPPSRCRKISPRCALWCRSR